MLSAGHLATQKLIYNAALQTYALGTKNDTTSLLVGWGVTPGGGGACNGGQGTRGF